MDWPLKTHHSRLHSGRGDCREPVDVTSLGYTQGLLWCSVFLGPFSFDLLGLISKVCQNILSWNWEPSSCFDMYTPSVTRDCPVETRDHLAFQIQQSTSLPKNITIILIIPRKNVPEDKCSCVARTISPTSLIHCSEQQHHWTSSPRRGQSSRRCF